MNEPIPGLKPLRLRSAVDYSYGLALADMHMNVMQDGNIFLSLALHNASDGAICFQFEKIEFKMNGCILVSKDPPKHRPVIVSRGMHNIYPCPPLKRMAVNAIPQLSGKINFVVKYGHPDESPVRCAEWEYNLTLVIAPPQPRIAMTVDSYSETQIIETMQ